MPSMLPNSPADKWRRAKPFVAGAALLILCPLCACCLWAVGLAGTDTEDTSPSGIESTATITPATPPVRVETTPSVD